MSAYHSAIRTCIIRYIFMTEDLNIDTKLRNFMFEVETATLNLDFPVQKLNRWLGYVQGCLIQLGITDVETERNWTRPLFQPLDFGVNNG